MDSTEDKVCPICLEKPTNPFVIPCKHEFCYLCLKRASGQNNSCPYCKAIIPDYVLEKAKISEDVLDFKENSGNWLYSGRNNGWWHYSLEHDKIIEDAWQVYKSVCSDADVDVTINILGRNYKINYKNMTQTSDNGVMRHIKRIDKVEEYDTIKGISGLQIVKKEDLPEMPKAEWPSPDQYNFNPDVWEDEDSFDEDEDSFDY